MVQDRKGWIHPPYHPSNDDFPTVPTLPPPPEVVTDALPPEYQHAWRVWANTLFLSGGDRAEADRAYEAALNRKRRSKP
jgi:hypothetical protein